MHLLSFATLLSRRSTDRIAAIVASLFGLAVVFAGSHTIAQTRIAFSAAAARTKPPHHELGMALAAVGTVTFALGVAVYAFEQNSLCNNASAHCNEAKDAGLVMLPVGGAVAVTGFYLQFHR